MAIQKNIIVRQVIGRTLLDAGKAGYAFDLVACREGWQVTIHAITAPDAERIIAFIADSNVFYTEHENEQLVRKWWLYSQQGAHIDYDSQKAKLSFVLDSMMSYDNETGKRPQ